MDYQDNIEVTPDKSLDDMLIFNMYAKDDIKQLVKEAPTKELSDLQKELWLVKFKMILLIGENVTKIGAESTEKICIKVKEKINDITKKITRILDSLSEEEKSKISPIYLAGILAQLLEISPGLNFDEHIFD